MIEKIILKKDNCFWSEMRFIKSSFNFTHISLKRLNNFVKSGIVTIENGRISNNVMIQKEIFFGEKLITSFNLIIL